MEFSSWILSGRRYREQQAWLAEQVADKPWLVLFADPRPDELRCGSLNSPCRLEPIPFDDCFVDRFFFLSRGPREELLGSALTMRISWDGRNETLPKGWQDTVRRCYRDCTDADGSTCNTLVGMLVFTLSHHRNKGLSGRFLDEMVGLARDLGHRWLVIPALPPSQFSRELAEMPFDELARRKRNDGLPADHWVRLHVRKGAEVIGHYSRSHRFALSTADFAAYISSDPVPRSGYHLVRLDRDLSFGMAAADTWQRVHADLDRDLVCFDWGCVWVRYDVQPK